MIHVFFRAAPWAIPMMIVFAVLIALATPWLGRRRGTPRWLVAAYLMSIGAFVAITLSPSPDAFQGQGWPHRWRTVFRSLRPDLPPLHYFTTVNELSLNIVAALPLGATAALLVVRTRRSRPLLAILVPVVCELLQGLVPQLDRVGFLLSDLINNEIGFVIGAVVGAAIGCAACLLPGSSWRRPPRRD